MIPSSKQNDELSSDCAGSFLSPARAGRMMKLRVLIADDEQLSRERLKRFLRSEPETELVAECASGPETLAAIRQKSPDLAFLDVRMPEIDGFGVLQSLRGTRLPAIIFVTAYDHFALRAFEIDAVDYLLKPFDRQRFQTALRRARHRLRLLTESLVAVEVPAGHQAANPERITIKSGGKILLLKTSDIDWVSAADNYVELHAGDKTHLLRMTISGFAKNLGGDQFVRISRSVMVRLDSIKEIRSKSHGDYFVVLHNGANLAGSRNYRSSLRTLFRTNPR